MISGFSHAKCTLPKRALTLSAQPTSWKGYPKITEKTTAALATPARGSEIA